MKAESIKHSPGIFQHYDVIGSAALFTCHDTVSGMFPERRDRLTSQGLMAMEGTIDAGLLPHHLRGTNVFIKTNT